MGQKRSRSNSLSSTEDPSSPSVREDTPDAKIVHLDASPSQSPKPTVMKCELPPHEPLEFDSFEGYDVHYQKTHMNRCTECGKNFPDAHFLNLHIAEYHDPINAAKRDKGENIYACLIPTCDRLCSTPQKRRLHCIDKHAFPRSYDFIVIMDGIDTRSSMLQSPGRRRRSSIMSSISVPTGTRQRSSTMGSVGGAGDAMHIVRDENDGEAGERNAKSPTQQRAPFKLRGRGGFGHGPRGRGRGRGRGSVNHIEGQQEHGTTANESQLSTKATSSSDTAADPMEGLTSKMSSLQFVPHSVRLARGRGRGQG